MLVNKIKIVIFILLLIGTLIGCFYWGNKNITLDEKINAEYRMVNFDNIVSGKIEAWRYRGLNNYSSSWQVGKEQLVTFPWAENWAYSKRHLSLFLQENDSVFKPQNSDTLYIYRNNEQFYFVLRRRVFRKLHH